MIFTENSISQQKNRDVKVVSRTFQVSDVEKSNELLPSRSYNEIIKGKMIEPKRAPLPKFEATAKKNIDLVSINFDPFTKGRFHPFANTPLHPFAKINFHSFIETLHHAYAKHYPVTISPDMIWLLIAQGFANHVNENGEAMRHYFVDFDGKKNLDVCRNEFVKGSPNNDWKGVFAEFGVQIQKNIGADLLELVTGDFSTTTAFEKVAFQVALMDAMKSYFTYSVTTRCGIPEITLEGTVEDWKRIETKAQTLAQYDLELWIDGLMPILKEFTAAAKGKVNKDFWESIYKIYGGSGGPTITGWILKFFPYMKRGDKSFPFAVKFKEPSPDEKRAYRLSAETNQFPSGLSKVDFIWNYYETFYEMEFTAGFVGFHQDPETLSLRPEISWAVIDKNEKPSEEQIKNYRRGGDEDYLKSVGKQ